MKIGEKIKSGCKALVNDVKMKNNPLIGDFFRRRNHGNMDNIIFNPLSINDTMLMSVKINLFDKWK